jgi:hypothetical protein
LAPSWPKPDVPWRSVQTLRYETNLPLAIAVSFPSTDIEAIDTFGDWSQAG